MNAQPVTGEHGLAIVDRHTGYVWCEKTGDQATGTAEKVLEILVRQLNAGIYQVKRFKTDHGSNLMGGIIKEVSQQLGIWQDSSSAYHPAGNRLAENAVQRIKKAIGERKISEAMEDIMALNHGQPYNNKRLTPFEALFGIVSPVNGIPMTDKSMRVLVRMVNEQKERKRKPTYNSSG